MKERGQVKRYDETTFFLSMARYEFRFSSYRLSSHFQWLTGEGDVGMATTLLEAPNTLQHSAEAQGACNQDHRDISR